MNENNSNAKHDFLCAPIEAKRAEKMDAITKPHVVCVPLPAQGHINPMLKLAKLLHLSGFYITFVHTKVNFDRMVKFRGQNSLKGLPDFRFETISDGLPEDNQRGILDLPQLCRTMPIDGLISFRELIARLMDEGGVFVPPVTCIVSDGVMGFTLKVAQEFNIPEFMLFTPSACGMLGYLNFEELKNRGYFPLKDEKNLCDGYLDTEVDWIPAMKGVRLKDLPTFLRTTDSSDTMFNYNIDSVNNAMKAKGVILNTFEDLESEVLDAIRIKYPHLYPIGPLSMLHQHLSNSTTQLDHIDSNLWKEDPKCLEWLDKREKDSVVYVNFGSLVIMTPNQLKEFAWGLANSKYHFLWVIRPNLVECGSEIITSDEYVREICDRGLILGWCPQEKVLRHPSIGGFLTHCGWNSTLESICEGVPMACWPFFAEQQTNSFYALNKWGIGIEIESDVKREQVEGLVRELIGGDKGKQMRNQAMQWKHKAEAATSPGGSSYSNFNHLVLQLKGQ